ncbi:MAG: EamA family transporter RarD [Inquilinus sp.]|nr:EamA family transporter RarD [Inquilinus sp.]
MTAASRRETMIGLAAALGAFIAWGFAPIYFKAIAFIPALEILAHRVIWTLVMLVVIVLALGRIREVALTLLSPRRLGVLCVTTLLVSTNWLVFIWAIQNDRLLEGSLGYYINPLVNVVLGVVFLSERLSRWQGVAVALAAAGVAAMVIGIGTVPWVALTLALSFGFYALVRKKAKVDPLIGLVVETLLLLPLALAYLIWLGNQGTGAFDPADWSLSALLVCSGLVTGTPLVLFMHGAQRLTLSTIGLMQYLAPSIHFLLALLIFGEEFTRTHLVTFGFIWIGLALYSWDAMNRYRRETADAAAGA